MTRLAFRLRIPLHHLLLGALLLMTVLPAVVLSGHSQAASMTWDGGGATNNWSDCANWSGDVCPTAGDVVTFDGTSVKDSVVDAGFAGTVATVNINSGYTGTISLGTNLTVSSTFSQAAGTFTAGSQTLTLAAFTLSGGSFTASSETTNIGGALTVSGSSTFNANSGTVNFDASSTATLTCNTVAFNLVSLTNTATTTVSSNCNLPLGANPTIAGSGNVTLKGTLSGSGTLSKPGATLTLNSGSLSGFSGISIGSALTISNGTSDFSNYTSFSDSGTLTISGGVMTLPNAGASIATLTLSSGGTLNASSGTTTVTQDFTINSGSAFNANGGTVDFSGTSSAAIACNYATFNLVMFTHTAGTKTVGSDCDLPLGNNPSATGGGSITSSGTLLGSGTLTTAGTLTLLDGSCSGVGGGSSSVDENNMNGTPATGFGCGGGGAGWYGGKGGNGMYGGGGGGAAGRNSMNQTGGSGGGGVVVFSPAGASDVVRTSGSSWTVPAGVTSVKVWAIGGGGGGAGSTTSDSTSGGGGGGGGVAYKTLSVTPGEVISYDLGDSGSGGTGATNGSNGGDTTITADAATITANGGAGGLYNTNTTAAGGSFSGGDGGATGGTGSGASGDTGGGGGGAIGGGNGARNGGTGGTGGTASNVSGLLPIVSGQGYALTGGAISGFSGLSTSALTVNGSYYLGSLSTLSVSGTFILNSGAVFTAPASTASFGGTFTINSGATFNANGGTVNFNGAASTITCNNATFNLVTFTHSGGTKTVSSDCNLPLGVDPTFTGSIGLNGTLSGSGLLTGQNRITLNSGGALTGFNGFTSSSGGMTVNGNYDFSGYTTFYIHGANFFVNAGASVTMPSASAEIDSNITIDPSSNFNANGGTIILSATNDNSNVVSCGNKTFALVILKPARGFKTISSDCVLPLGNNPTAGLDGGAVILNGTLTGSGTVSAGTLALNATGSLVGFSGLTASALNVNHGTWDFGTYGTFSVAGDLGINATDAVFTAPPTMSVSGNFSNAGTFTANGGTVVLNGSNQSVSGDTTFYNLTKTVTSDDALTLVAGSTTTVASKLTLHGNSSGSALLSLASDTPGSPWYLDAQDSTNVYSVDVSDSHVLGDSITACTSVNDGGNTGWIFNPSSCESEHGGSGANTSISNYVALQTYLANQQARYSQTKTSQNQAANQDAGGLPDKIRQFITEFPNSKAITTGLTDFLKATVIGLLVGLLIGLGWWLWIILARRRKSGDSHILPPQATRIVMPTVVAPADIKEHEDTADSHHNDNSGGTA